MDKQRENANQSEALTDEEAEAAAGGEISPSPSDSGKVFVCDKCHRSYKDYLQYRQHRETAHGLR